MRDPLVNKMFGATLIAGAISGVTFMTVPGALMVGPGLLFGLATAWVFRSAKWFDFPRALLWVLASTGAWYLAIRNYISHVSTSGNAGGYGSDINNMLIAGSIGSAVLVVALSLLIKSANVKGVITTIGAGAALAAVMYAILSSGSGTQLGGAHSLLPYVKFAGAFALWQAGVGVGLLLLKRK